MNPDTPYTVALSHNELVAVIKYHAACIRALPKKVGAISMKMVQDNKAHTRELNMLHKEAKEVAVYHGTRCRGLVSLLPPKPKG